MSADVQMVVALNFFLLARYLNGAQRLQPITKGGKKSHIIYTY